MTVELTGFAPDVVAMLVETARRILGSDGPETLVAELCEAGIAHEVAADTATAGALLAVQGQQLGRSTLLDLVLAGAEYRPGTRVALPMPGERRPPGIADAKMPGTVFVNGIVRVPEGAEDVIVHTADGALRVRAGVLSVAPTAGLDSGLGAAVVRGAAGGAAVEPVHAAPWAEVAATAAVALAHELVGVGQRALGAAVAHVVTREQFGRPIAALQSVRHRLATVHVDLEAARAVLAADAARDEVSAMTAKAAAGRAALGAVAAAQQVCGAMGFTAEHGLHATVRRALVLDSLFGSVEDLESEIGALLAARGSLPLPVPLWSTVGSAAADA